MKKTNLRFFIETTNQPSVPFATTKLDRRPTDVYLHNRQMFAAHRGATFLVETLYNNQPYQFTGHVNDVVAKPAKTTVMPETAVCLAIMALFLYFVVPAPLLNKNMLTIGLGLAGIFGMLIGSIKKSKQARAAVAFNESKYKPMQAPRATRPQVAK